jgi:hypothetical protein
MSHGCPEAHRSNRDAIISGDENKFQIIDDPISDIIAMLINKTQDGKVKWHAVEKTSAHYSCDVRNRKFELYLGPFSLVYDNKIIVGYHDTAWQSDLENLHKAIRLSILPEYVNDALELLSK